MGFGVLRFKMLGLSVSGFRVSGLRFVSLRAPTRIELAGFCSFQRTCKLDQKVYGVWILGFRAWTLQ